MRISNFLIAVFAASLAVAGSARAELTELYRAPAQLFSSSPLNWPRAVVVDGAGNLFVTGFYSHNVLKVTPAGVITEIADETGDGSGLSHAALSYPTALAADAAGNVYVASGLGDGNLFKIEPSGAVTLLIYDAAHPLTYPGGIAVDSVGNVFVAGDVSDNVYKITPGGQITEILDGSGDGTGNILDAPNGVAVDSAGNVYVAGWRSDNVFKITPAGQITEILGSTGGGVAFLFRPTTVAVDGNDNVIVAGAASNNVFRITPGGQVTELIDSTGDGAGNVLSGPRWLAVGDGDQVYVVGEDSDNLFEISAAGAVSLVTDAATIPLLIDFGPIAAAPGPTLFIAGDDPGTSLRASDAVMKLPPSGIATRVVDQYGAATKIPFYDPVGLVVDPSGDIYVGGNDTHNAIRIAPDGSVSEIIDFNGDGLGNYLSSPSDVAADPSGNVYIAGAGSDNVFKVAPGGQVSAIIDSNGDGAGNPLYRPSALATDVTGNVFVAGANNDNVFKVAPGGQISLVLDSTGDGGGNVLEWPDALVCDLAGNLFVRGAQSANVFKVTPGGVASVVFDSPATSFTTGSSTPLTVDAAGNLYVTNAFPDAVYRVTPAGETTTIIDEAGDSKGNPLDTPTNVAVDDFGNIYVSSNGELFSVASSGEITEILDQTRTNFTPAAPDALRTTATGELIMVDFRGVFSVASIAATCDATPTPTCIRAGKAKLKYDERKSGRESMKVQWRTTHFGGEVAPNHGDFGDVVDGIENVAMCIYDDAGTLIQEWIIPPGGTCAGKPCWSRTALGFRYKDRDVSAQGVQSFRYDSINSGSAQIKGKNNAKKGQVALPTGVVAGLTGSVAPTVQLLTSNNLCIEALMETVQKDDGVRYSAKKP